MAGWKYKLESDGKLLRDLIDGDETIENIIAIYKQLIVCLKMWKSRLTTRDKEDWEYDIETMIEDLECACPDMEDNSLVFKEEQDNLNCYLSDFYDICDSARVWIGL